MTSEIVKNVLCECTLTPIIGIVTQELEDDFIKEFGPASKSYKSYIAASYVKIVESAGARVVPIFTQRDEFYYRQLLKSINGVLIPGGGAILKKGYPFYDTTKIIYSLAKEINDEIEGLFPILGVCAGIQTLLIHTVNVTTELGFLEYLNVFKSLPVGILGDYNQIKKTRSFSSITVEQYNMFKYENIAAYSNKYGMTVAKFEKSEKLNSDWRITAAAENENGEKFVSAMEHIKYPFFATQFHPEKSAFEWRVNYVNHSANAISANQYFYNVLVKFARTNCNKFEDKEVEYNSLIYNYEVFDNRKFSSFKFMQIYLFKQ